MKQIYRKTPMPKWDFNKVAMQHYWNHTSTWVFSCKSAAYFQNTFFEEQLWRAASGLNNFMMHFVERCLANVFVTPEATRTLFIWGYQRPQSGNIGWKCVDIIHFVFSKKSLDCYVVNLDCESCYIMLENCFFTVPYCISLITNYPLHKYWDFK